MTEGRETSEPKIVVFHDYFAIRGGGERLVLTLANRLGTRLVYGYRTPDSFEPEMFPTSSHSLGCRMSCAARECGRWRWP